jgi:hypothetical protein
MYGHGMMGGMGGHGMMGGMGGMFGQQSSEEEENKNQYEPGFIDETTRKTMPILTVN